MNVTNLTITGSGMNCSNSRVNVTNASLSAASAFRVTGGSVVGFDKGFYSAGGSLLHAHSSTLEISGDCQMSGSNMTVVSSSVVMVSKTLMTSRFAGFSCHLSSFPKICLRLSLNSGTLMLVCLFRTHSA